MHNLLLFPEPSSFDREGLARKLAELARDGVWIGTSSWKYEGWIGQIYTAGRYSARGRISPKRFQQECLAEYGEVFPIVCGDFSFYQFPPAEYWRRLFALALPKMRWALKAPEEITAKLFPKHSRYGARAGEGNVSYLDAALLQGMFLNLLAPYRERLAVIVLEFGTFPKQCYERVEEFVADLDKFFEALPGTFRYAVELRNQEFLSTSYFECLRRHDVAHVFNAWTRMPEIGEQIRMGEAYTADFTVARALLRRGRPYEQAVKIFSPYREIQDPNPSTRLALRELIARARERREPSYIFVNNRFEGNAPGTIEAVVDD